MSRVGKKPISLPGNVKAGLKNSLVKIEGPKGNLEYFLPLGISAEIKDGEILVKRSSDSKEHKSLHGLARSLINNMVKGVTEGFVKQLEIVGVGFRAQVQGKHLDLQLGYSHTLHYPIPEGITMETPKPTQIFIKGIDKFKVGQVAAEVRSLRKPEPYKGKGIRYAGEYIRRKAGKTVG